MEIKMSINSNGTKTWHNKDDTNYWHREDGPARVLYNGEEYWWYYNQLYHDEYVMPLNLFLAYCRWEYRKNGS